MRNKCKYCAGTGGYGFANQCQQCSGTGYSVKMSVIYHDLNGYDTDTDMHSATLRDIWKHWKACGAKLTVGDQYVHAQYKHNGETVGEMLYDGRRR